MQPPATTVPSVFFKRPSKGLLIFLCWLPIGAVLAYIDNKLGFYTVGLEVIHTCVATTIWVYCLKYQRRYPEINQFGWNTIVWGISFLTMASWLDIFDDPPTIALLEYWHIPLTNTWQQAFFKKILGYISGISLLACGFYQWIPWMIQTRLNVQKLNQKLGMTNQQMNRILMSLEEHVESERLNISRELHDDVAQQLTFINIQIQLCQKELKQDVGKATARLEQIRSDLGEAMRSVRQISQDLRPESLYALGLIPALEQFLEKLRVQMPEVALNFAYHSLADEGLAERVENYLGDRDLLHVFRLVQEGVRNSLKHAKAENIAVSITEFPEMFCFLIEDDGVGLPWPEPPTDDTLVQQGHLGIAGMRERAREIEAQLTWSNNPDTRGARMRLMVNK